MTRLQQAPLEYATHDTTNPFYLMLAATHTHKHIRAREEIGNQPLDTFLSCPATQK